MPKFVASAQTTTSKSQFFTSRFRNGMVLRVTGYTFVVEEGKENDVNARRFPVLTTTLNNQPFDNIWVATLVRSIITADGQELTPEGSLNKEAQRLWLDDSITTDEDALKALVAFINNRNVTIKRDRGYKRLFSNGNIGPSILLEFNVG